MNEVKYEQDFYGWTPEQARVHLAENPSLEPQLNDIVEQAYRLALLDAERQTKVSRGTFPAACPWTFDEMLSGQFWPDRSA